MATSGNTDQQTDRLAVAVRLNRGGVAEIDAMAEAEERTRSQMIRILLREAVQARLARRQR